MGRQKTLIKLLKKLIKQDHLYKNPHQNTLLPSVRQPLIQGYEQYLLIYYVP